jgi:hypothetical protein
MDSTTSPTQLREAATVVDQTEASSAPPLVAAAFAAGIVYMWVEALFRLLFTYNADFNARWVLWNGRVGDIAAMWLTMGVAAVIVFFVLGFGVFRGRSHVGSVPVWVMLLVISAIAAPLIGEIGTPTGI